MGLTDERKTNNNKTVQKTTGDGNTDGQTGGNTGSGSGEGTKTNANWPDFSKLTRVQDVLDRNKRILHHIKLNHDSQRPEALAKNFMLLSEVNANIESVQRLYVDIERDYISFMENNVSKSGGKQIS